MAYKIAYQLSGVSSRQFQHTTGTASSWHLSNFTLGGVSYTWQEKQYLVIDSFLFYLLILRSKDWRLGTRYTALTELLVILVQFVSWVKWLLWFTSLLDWPDYLHQMTVLAGCRQTQDNIYKKKTTTWEINKWLPVRVGLFQSNISNVYAQLLWGALPGAGSFVTGSNMTWIPPSLVFKYALCRTVNSEYRVDICIWWH